MSYAIDAELLPWLDMLPKVVLTDYDTLVAARGEQGQLVAVMPAYQPVNPLDVRDELVPGPPGSPDVRVRVYSRRDRENPVPGLVYIHGGGFVLGTPRCSKRP
jgi:acetyl esterase